MISFLRILGVYPVRKKLFRSSTNNLPLVRKPYLLFFHAKVLLRETNKKLLCFKMVSPLTVVRKLNELFYFSVCSNDKTLFHYFYFVYLFSLFLFLVWGVIPFLGGTLGAEKLFSCILLFGTVASRTLGPLVSHSSLVNNSFDWKRAKVFFFFLRDASGAKVLLDLSRL